MVDGASTAGTKFWTQRFGKELPRSAFRQFGRTRWECSAAGFGCYRVDAEFPSHRKALRKALTSGCNLIDTSTNYTDGSSERCVGEVLEECFKEKLFSREEVILVSKVGYIQGENLGIVQQASQEGRSFADVVHYMDGCWHCISPAFIEDQLTRTLARMKQKTLDVYLLHNPEYFLSDLRKNKSPLSLEDRRKEYYRRIRAAFIQMEREVKKGRMQFYGASSNTFVRNALDPEASSLSRFVTMAEEAAHEIWGDANKHHFAVAQMPANLFETGAWEETNCGEKEKQSALEFAEGKNIAVLINRPLNAIVGNELVRLADYSRNVPKRNLANLFEEVVGLEERWQAMLPAGMEQAKDWFLWGTKLKDLSLEKIPADQWNEIQNDMILPQIEHGVQIVQISESIPQSAELQEWIKSYRARTGEMLEGISAELCKEAQRKSDEISRGIQDRLPADWRQATLSQKAVAALANTTGVSSVLVGMRRESYVDDVLGALRLPAHPLKASNFPSV